MVCLSMYSVIKRKRKGLGCRLNRESCPLGAQTHETGGSRETSCTGWSGWRDGQLSTDCEDSSRSFLVNGIFERGC